MIEKDNCCVACGEIIPEGRQVCPSCESRAEQISLAERAWEGGYTRCIYTKRECVNRPCTAAQNTWCCHQCEFESSCGHACGKDKR